MPRWKSSILIDIRTSFQPIRCIWKFCIFLLTTCGVWWWVGYVKWQSRLQISCSVHLNQYSTIIQCQIHPGWKTSSAQIDQIEQNVKCDLFSFWLQIHQYLHYKSCCSWVRSTVNQEMKYFFTNMTWSIQGQSIFWGGWGAAVSWLVCWWKFFNLWKTSRWYFFDSDKGSKNFETPKQCIFGPLYFCHRASQISKSTFERK